MKYRIGIDLGGTSIKAGVVDEAHNIISSHQKPTLEGFELVVADMAETAQIAAEMVGLKWDDFSSVGVGSPGFINPQSGLLVLSSNTNWRNKPLKQELQKHIPVPVFIGNDADCAVIGEMIAGAAKGYRNILMLTLGTGVGGGLILNGRLFSGCDGMGAEFGHTPLISDGLPCACGQNGCLEVYASVTALIRQTKEAMKENPETQMHAHVEKYGEVSGKTAFDCAREGDVVALRVVDQYCNYLANGIGGFITLFRPEIVLIGGGLSAAGDTLLDPIRMKIGKFVFASNYIGTPQIERAALGNDAGMIGAAYLGDI
ncbi:MAG: ROK family glucokinase [Clostridiaceae bacterium]|nr:ROK family glucokinase [Clostridiaceae bacterium]